MPPFTKSSVVSISLLIILIGVLLPTQTAHAQAEPTAICPAQGIQQRPAEFQPSGIILTTFDRNAIWVYDIGRDTRYPLPETVPCIRNCTPSPDGLWLAHMNIDESGAFYKMRFDGTQRTRLISNATDVQWWNSQTLLVWTPDHRAYLVPESNAMTAPRDYLDVSGVVDVQPGGRYALTIRQNAEGTFIRKLENLELRGLTGVAGAVGFTLGEDISYYNGAAWSPDGNWLAYVKRGVFDDNIGVYGSELFGVQPGDTEPIQWTNLHQAYGATRINGQSISDLSWSPNGKIVAFWVTELIGGNPLADTGSATIHTYNVETGTLRAYCGYSTVEHTPNPPRLVWSPDSTHLVFGGNVPGDDEGYLLLALDVSDGRYTRLSTGIYPALGTADVIAWGERP